MKNIDIPTYPYKNNVQRRPRGLNKREAGTRKHPRQKPIVKEKSGPSHGTLKKYVPADVTPKKSSRSAIPKVHQVSAPLKCAFGLDASSSK